MPAASPEQIARSFTVSATSIIDGTADLRTYPHRYLSVVSSGPPSTALPEVLSCAQFLGQFGWELVNVTDLGASRITNAILRRG
ncbi:transcriptional regulator [Plantactinospora siamensis]|uniref:Transcriptional regulator n=1 Tax=Plantactinospora siamensis TaxID=555372 RepID=A0ABV6NVL1_9ACTN